MVDFLTFVVSSSEWGDVRMARPIPRHGDPWGCLAPLRETPWKNLIPTVGGEVFSHALHGHVVPLMNEIGPEPRGLLKMVPEVYRFCDDFGHCVSAREKDCQPGPTLPECYTVPALEREAQRVATAVVLYWAEGRYVVVVDYGEFSL